MWGARSCIQRRELNQNYAPSFPSGSNGSIDSTTYLIDLGAQFCPQSSPIRFFFWLVDGYMLDYDPNHFRHLLVTNVKAVRLNGDEDHVDVKGRQTDFGIHWRDGFHQGSLLIRGEG